MSNRFYRWVVVALVLAVGFMTTPGVARLPPPPPPCQPLYATVHFHIWGGQAGIINFNGAQYHDGGTASVNTCTYAYAISVNTVPAGYSFRQWASDSGDFLSQTSTSTTFLTSGFSGGITMVLNGGQWNWGGYVADTTTALQGATAYMVSGTFVLPSQVSYVSAPNNGADSVGFWLGLGGVGTNLWQAGVVLTLSQGGSTDIRPFYEEVLADSSCCGAYSIVSGSYSVALGDTITVKLYYDTAIGALFNITDGTSWASRRWTTNFEPCEWGPAEFGGAASSYCRTPFVPGTTTTEWIGEAPITAGVSFFFGWITWTVCGVPLGQMCVLPNYGNIPFSQNSMRVTNIAGWEMAFVRWVGYDYQNHGWTNPGYMTSADFYTSESWYESWGASPG